MSSGFYSPDRHLSEQQSTDDHGDSGSATTDHSLFGSIIKIEVVKGSLSIFVIVLTVVTIEKIFHHARRVTEDTPFQDLILAVEKVLKKRHSKRV